MTDISNESSDIEVTEGDVSTAGIGNNRSSSGMSRRGFDMLANEYFDEEGFSEQLDEEGLGFEHDDEAPEEFSSDRGDEDLMITHKLAISKNLIRRVKDCNFDCPLINAILSGNVQIMEYLLKQGLTCPLTNFKITYALAAGYHIEDISQAMLEILHSAAQACVGDMNQDFPPCQGCRENLRENAISSKQGQKMF